MGLYYHITVGLLRVYNKYKLTVCILFTATYFLKKIHPHRHSFLNYLFQKIGNFIISHIGRQLVCTPLRGYIIQLRLVIQLTITHNGVILPYHCGVIKGLQ